MISFKKFIVEGGNAVPDVGRIHRDNIDDTVESFKANILKPLEIKIGAEDLLGSSHVKSRLKDEYGDIDIMINYPELPFKDPDVKKVLNWLANKLLEVNPKLVLKVNSGFKSISVAYPIVNSMNASKAVQIDLMLSDMPEYTRFQLASPTKPDKYTKKGGAYRNILLQSIARKGSDKDRSIDINRGLKIVEDGGVATYITDPDKIKQELFGTVDVNVDSFDSIWGFLKTSPLLKNRLEDIKRYMTATIGNYNKRDPKDYPMPTFENAFRKFYGNILVEGGNVFDDTLSIKKEYIPNTILKFLNELSRIFPKKASSFKSHETLGSVGKKPISGDIDLLYDIKNFMPGGKPDLAGWGLNLKAFSNAGIG